MILLYALTLLLSAGLLFSVQPMIAKWILPKFGGAPAVWNASMLFFQLCLLAGYGYAHLTATRLRRRPQLALHLGVMLLPLLVLPIRVAAGWAPPEHGQPVVWVLGLLLTTVGLPFFVVSSSAPLLQRWFAETDHPSARDPYFLYAASNAGSMVALLGYPLLVEPALPLAGQGRAWSVGYGALLLLTAACALARLRRGARTPGSVGAAARPAVIAPPAHSGARQRLVWVLLAAVPSSLMLGVTTYVTTDLAPIPLFWVVPLALYLLTFILAFGRSFDRGVAVASRMVPAAAVLAIVALLLRESLGAAAFGFHLVTFFVAALACHGRLARLRPHPDQLTEYFLWIALGGALGGAFNALLAPWLFHFTAEYPLALLAAVALGSRPAATPPRWRDAIVLAAIPLAAAAIHFIVAIPVVRRVLDRATLSLDVPDGSALVRAGVPALLCLVFVGRPRLFALALGAVLALGALATAASLDVRRHSRNFFGEISVVADRHGGFMRVYHGHTLHGGQFSDARRRTATLYYFPNSPIGQVFRTRGPGLRNVGVIGLGVGSLAAYGRRGQSFVFYEIDPDMEAVARDTSLFTYLFDSEARCRVVIGDGRLSLAREPDPRFDLLVVDAFSSDAIPIHLLTREALDLYLGALSDSGLVAFQVTNRYLELESVIGDVAGAAGAACIARHLTFEEITSADDAFAPTSSRWVVVARRPADLAAIAALPGWHPVPPRAGRAPWADDRSHLLGAIRW